MKEPRTGSVDQRTKRITANIIMTQGSRGLPSCGCTDARRLGGGENEDSIYIGGTDYRIEPGTPYSFWPFSLLGKLLSHRLPKSPRNYEKWLIKHNK